MTLIERLHEKLDGDRQEISTEELIGYFEKLAVAAAGQNNKRMLALGLAAADALAAMEWRPIEDAPISTPIWAKCPWDGEVHICRIVIEECQNQDSFSREFYLARNYSNHASYDTVFERPTHFMLIKEMKSD